MKLRKCFFALIICVMFVLAGCGGETVVDNEVTVDTDTPKSSEDLANIRDNIGKAAKVTRSSGVNEKELLAILNESSDFFSCFAPNAGFVASSIQINNRNTEKKETDEIYATITSVNEYSSYTAEFYLLLTYYDEGGWRLEFLTPNNDGVYQINYWPQEEDLNAVWTNKYAEMYNNGIVAKAEVEDTGNDYMMYLVTYYREGAISLEFAWAEVLFRFENGLWTTSSMSYPTSHVWRPKTDTVCGTYLSTVIHDSDMNVWILNLYTDGKDGTTLLANLYEYIIDTNEYSVYYTKRIDKPVSLNLYSIGIENSTFDYNDGDWHHNAKQIDTSNTSLSETDARTMIQQMVEDNGFPYWTDYESAKQAKRQEGFQDLEQTVDFTSYRKACIDYYGRLELTFPADLDPCMYEFYLDESLYELPGLELNDFYEIMNNKPNPLDYMDSSIYEQLSRIYYNS